MKVSDLINILSQFDPEREVRIAQPQHDYWHSTAAVDINEFDIGLVNVQHSDYFRADVIADESDYEDEELKEVVLLG